jgi:hypothetical protein
MLSVFFINRIKLVTQNPKRYRMRDGGSRKYPKLSILRFVRLWWATISSSSPRLSLAPCQITHCTAFRGGTGARRSCGYQETYAGCKHNCTCKLQILAVTCNHQKMHARFTPEQTTLALLTNYESSSGSSH